MYLHCLCEEVSQSIENTLFSNMDFIWDGNAALCKRCTDVKSAVDPV